MQLLALFVKYAKNQNKFKNYLKMVKTTQKSTKFILSWHTNDFLTKKFQNFQYAIFFQNLENLISLHNTIRSKIMCPWSRSVRPNKKSDMYEILQHCHTLCASWNRLISFEKNIQI